ncbi:MAG: serine/threonine protein kinase [Acidimicrobiia bacterium]|nr:serine/threonine protein kinase [Acidimicrobiia bacterium]MYB74748.1 serine/threonine protein kinase [Acidimicrobiia bacterium]MYH99405.1 serine/threonine protein kinase [Acidimicrobiia bacterium]
MPKNMIVPLSRDWQVGDVIGKGGFGRVHEASDGQIEAAAKFVPKAKGADRDLLAVELSDVPNVVPILDSGEFEDDYVIVMPRAEYSLRDFVAEAEFKCEELVVEVLRDISECLAALDEQVVHRDIKPENILWLDGSWCLTDFGIARYAEATTAPDTRKHAMSPPYASPERWRNERATSASDVYSLGVVAYEIAAGCRPYEEPGLEDISEHFREQHLHAPVQPIDSVPQQLGSLIEECLYKAAGARPTAANLLARLDRLPQQSASPGLASLREAHHLEVARRAEAAREASELATEAERREQLKTAALQAYQLIVEGIATAFIGEAPAIRQLSDSGTTLLRLGSAQLALSEPRVVQGSEWPHDERLFDVIATADFRLLQSTKHNSYKGRSHSLWYCDAKEPGTYGWFETAFMQIFSSRRPNSLVAYGDPFALDPDEASALALSPVVSGIQAAWPFTQIAPADLDELVVRWANWFASASEGRLYRPSSMPEQDPHGSWRRG